MRKLTRHLSPASGAALILSILLALRCYGEERPLDGLASADSYELRYLGYSLKENANTHTHEGRFLFIWKAQKPTKVSAYVPLTKGTFLPFPSFGVHYATGWKNVGSWCGTGASWEIIQPGQVISFSIDMGWVEHDFPGYPSMKEADRAQLQISSMDGYLVSDEFPLPLVKNRSK